MKLDPKTPGSAAPAALKHELSRHREALREAAAQPEAGGYALSVANTAVLEGIVRMAFTSARTRCQAGDQAMALVAVGSFGRGALSVHSDVDVRIVVGHDAAAAEAVAEAMLYPLWDAGLSIGHQVVTPGEWLALFYDDLASATALLDARTLEGDDHLLQELLQRAYDGPFSEAKLADFVRRLEQEASERHERFGDSVYLLEPDVKYGAGGLRDFDLAVWAAKARFRPRSQGTDLAAELVKLGVLVPREQQAMVQARELLHRVRNHLHLLAGRRADRLTFERQEELAGLLGFVPPGDASPERLGQGVEEMMQRYYQEARAVAQARRSLFGRATPFVRRRSRPHVRELGHGVRIWDGHVTYTRPEDFADDPALVLRLFAACIEHELPLLPHARDTVMRLVQDEAFAATLRAAKDAGPLFVDLIASSADTPFAKKSALAEAHEIGLLTAMIPEFTPVTGRVHHDLYHVYTVDVHSVAATDAMRAISRGERATEWPIATRVFAELERPHVAFLAALLHDVGKGYPDAAGSRKNHSESGRDLVRVILPRLGEDAETTELVALLVAEHLTLYHTATRRDLDDPATVGDFVARLHTKEALEHLYLLTLVDISTTAPKALTSWKVRMMAELYERAAESLEGQARANDPRAFERLVEQLEPGEAERVARFAASMPPRYRRLHPPARIREHALLAVGRGRELTLRMFDSEVTDTVELTVVGDDAPGLLAQVAAAITGGRLEIVAADVYSRTNESGHTEAVDLFLVRDRTEGAAGAREALSRLESDLRQLLRREIAPEQLFERRRPGAGRRGPPVTSEVVVRDDASPELTVIEVFGRDRPGLLYGLAAALTELGLRIAHSRINTEGNRVADVFYVRDTDGKKVAPARFAAVRRRLLEVVGGHVGRVEESVRALPSEPLA